MPFRECLTKCGACCVARQLFVLCSQIFLFSAIVPVALCELVIQAFHIKLYTEPEQKHVIVITGASAFSSGIGAALAKEMAKPGRSLVLVARSADRLNQVRNTCRRLGANVEIKSLDLKDTTAAKKYFEDVNQRYEVDVIVANAGATSVIDNLEDAPLHDIATNVYKMNVEGTVSTLMPFIEKFEQRRKGHIVVVGSVAGSFSFPNQIIYSSTKAFLNEFTVLLCRHLRQYGIITTLVTPGFVYTRTTALMQEKAGSWFPTFAMVSDTYAAKNIKYGIENNSRWVGFPWVEVVACLAASAIPPRFQSWLTLIGGSTGLGGVKYS